MSETPTGDAPFDLERAPLESSHADGRDWGGDGSDLARPVRAHVLALLRPPAGPYAPPVSGLLSIGDPRVPGADDRRAALGLGQEHVPELVRMLRDRALNTGDSDSDEVWAPANALLALGGLDLSEAVREIMPLLDLQDDLYDEDLPPVLGRAGEAALGPLSDYLADAGRWAFGHMRAFDALVSMAEQHPDLRERAVAVVAGVLERAEQYHELTPTAAVGAMIDLNEPSLLPLARRVYEAGLVDETINGAWDDVLEDLGQEADDDDPLVVESRRRFEERHEQQFPSAKREALLAALDATRRPAATPFAPQPAVRSGRKQKNKRKMQSASRKANRKKRR